jgi:hypothetical protein
VIKLIFQFHQIKLFLNLETLNFIKMKNIFLVAACLLVGLSSFAQQKELTIEESVLVVGDSLILKI